MKLYKGVAYFQEYNAAKVVRDQLPAGARIVDYTRGWAVQYFRSGPYYPETVNPPYHINLNDVKP